MQRLRAVGPVVLAAAALCLGTRTAAANAATLPTLAFSSPAPAAAVVGTSFTPAASTSSDQPVVFSVDANTTNAACVISNGVVSLEHAGACVIDAQVAGDENFLPALATQTISVTPSATTTDLSVQKYGLTATISAAAPGDGTPDGTVVFSIGGRVLGSSAAVNGVAKLPYSVPANVTVAILASFKGSGDYTGSSTTVTVNGPDVEPTFVAKPTIGAVLTSDAARNAHGWFHTDVRVHFICDGAGSAVLGGCPPTVVLNRSSADLSLRRTIRTLDGRKATLVLRDIKIDLSKPTVEIVGARNHALYHGVRPPVSCSASDHVSGIRSCKLKTTIKHGGGLETITYIATATSWAGVTERVSETVYSQT